MLTVQDTILVTNPVSLDAFLCNYYVIGNAIQIDTISQYLARIPKQLRRRNVIITFITSFGRIPISDFANFQNTCTTQLYTFKNGIENSNLLPFVLESHLPVTIAEESASLGSIDSITQILTLIEITWNTLKNKPTTFNPSIHTHIISDIVDLVIALNNKLETSLKGSANGLAELDENGFVKNTQLPSYVDDVLDGTWISNTVFNDLNNNPYTPEGGKIYLDTTYNKSYRWSGSIYVRITDGIALGETSETAGRGDRAKIAYEHTSLTNNPHNVTINQIGAAPASGSSNYVEVSPSLAQTGDIWMNGKAIFSGGNVGIDVVNPLKKLDIDGDILLHYGNNILITEDNIHFRTLLGITRVSAPSSEYFIYMQSPDDDYNDGIKFKSYAGADLLTIYDGGGIKASSLAGIGARLTTASSNGTLTPISNGTEGQVMKIVGGVPAFGAAPDGLNTTGMTTNFLQKWDGTKFIDWVNPRPQTIAASTSAVWDVNQGIDANMTMTGDAYITLQNLKVSTSGTLHITKQSTNYRLKFKGYTLAISRNIEWDSTGILITGNSKDDSYTWTYNGEVLTINGNKDYNRTSF